MNKCGIFIVGAPRSGTTLLQSILSSHSKIFTAPETSFFSNILPNLGIKFSNPDAGITANELKYIKDDLFRMTGIELPNEYLEPGSDNCTIRDAFEKLLNIFNIEEKPLWIEKTTIHARYMYAIQRFYPDAKFIHIIRDPVSSIGSMLNISPISFSDLRVNYIKSIREYSEFWNECVNAPLLFPGQENVLHLQYEELIETTEKSIRIVTDFLEIDYEPECLKKFHKTAENIISTEACPWQEANLSPTIDKNALYKWRNKLSNETIWLIQKRTLRLALYFGYFDAGISINYIKLFFIYVFDYAKWLVSRTRVERILKRLF